MFNRRKEVVVEAPAAPSVPTPTTLPEPSLGEMEREEYAKVAEEIGFKSSALVLDKIRAYLRSRDNRVYHLEEVEGFLAQQMPNNCRSIRWVALRTEDRIDPNWWYLGRDYGHCIVGFQGHGYSRPLPLPALYLVRDIEQKLGKNEVSFFVSDYASAMPDPFLAVAPRENITDLTVIFHWDEPNFR